MPTYLDQGVNVWGLVATIAFYLLILFIGLYASWKNRAGSSNTENIMLAGRDLGIVVGTFTTTATWVGGGFINGNVEMIFTPGQGLAHTTALFCYSFAYILGGIFFAGQMRRRGYVTMLDPFAEKYGKVIAGVLYIPCLLGEIFWTGSILSALGATLAVILGIDKSTAIFISAAIATIYTVAGGLYSVIWTDVIQLSCVVFGLCLGIGFAIHNPAVAPITETAGGPDGWLGTVPTDHKLGLYIEYILLVCLGGIPWQAYLQRVLAARTVRIAQLLPILGGVGCLLVAVPVTLMGAIAASADWNKTDYRLYRPVPVPQEDYTLILPLVLQYLTPLPVAVIGLAAVSAAVMSSADSSLMSSSSMFAHNIYGPFVERITKKTVSQRQKLWAIRLSVICAGVLATLIAISAKSIYFLNVLSSDLIYVMAFPQLTCAIHIPQTNTYGAILGLVVAFLLRLLGGEPEIGIPVITKYPYYDPVDNVQYFPFKTLTMLISLLVIISVSYLSKFLFKKGHVPLKWDVFECFSREISSEPRTMKTKL